MERLLNSIESASDEQPAIQPEYQPAFDQVQGQEGLFASDEVTINAVERHETDTRFNLTDHRENVTARMRDYLAELDAKVQQTDDLANQLVHIRQSREDFQRQLHTVSATISQLNVELAGLRQLYPTDEQSLNTSKKIIVDFMRRISVNETRIGSLKEAAELMGYDEERHATLISLEDENYQLGVDRDAERVRHNRFQDQLLMLESEISIRLANAQQYDQQLYQLSQQYLAIAQRFNQLHATHDALMADINNFSFTEFMRRVFASEFANIAPTQNAESDKQQPEIVNTDQIESVTPIAVRATWKGPDAALLVTKSEEEMLHAS